MRLRTIIFLFGLLTFGQVNGQLILTEEENLSWINKLKEEKELEGRLRILRTRILADTNVYVKNIGGRVVLMTQENKDKELGLCRPLLIVEGYYINVTWDIDNEQGYAEAYREVIHEDRVKVGSATKAPDYSFRLVGGKRLFFVEAKKPSVAVGFHS